MSNVTVWGRPARQADKWVRVFFGPAAATDWLKDLSDFSPAAEVVKDGDDAVVRLELPGVDVAKDVNVEIDRGRLVIHGERRDERAEKADGRTLSEVRSRKKILASPASSPAMPSPRPTTPEC